VTEEFEPSTYCVGRRRSTEIDADRLNPPLSGTSAQKRRKIRPWFGRWIPGTRPKIALGKGEPS